MFLGGELPQHVLGQDAGLAVFLPLFLLSFFFFFLFKTTREAQTLMEKKRETFFFFLVLNMNFIPVLSFMLGTMKYCCCHQRKVCWGRNALDYLMNP